MITVTSSRKGITHAIVLLLTVSAPLFVRAQFVADGQTNFLDDITTNIAETVTIGTNGSFTLLVVTNGSIVTNTGGPQIIGANSSATSNALVITGAGSVWSGSSFEVGGSGSFNQLSVLNGATVIGSSAFIGDQVNGSNNILLVSDSGSLWRSSGLQVGFGGAANNNQLIVSNGATVAISGNSYIGPGPGTNNSVVVTGPGSVFTNSGPLSVGGYGSRSLVLVTNGGQVFSGADSGISGLSGALPSAAVITGAGSSWTCGYFNLGFTGDRGMNQLGINNGGAFICTNTCNIAYNDNSNLLSVADSGSSLECQSFVLGYNGTANQCVVSNGARFSATSLSTVEGTFTGVSITGPGTVWTNAGDMDFGQFSNTLSIVNGAALIDSDGIFESGSGKPNAAIVAGPNSLWKNILDFHMEDSGAQLLVTNGATFVSRNCYFGDATAGSPNNNSFGLIAGPGSLWTNQANFYVGYNGASNEVLVTDSAKLLSSNIQLGDVGNGNQIIVSNSAVVVSTALLVGGGPSQNCSFTIAGGTLVVTNVGNGILVANGRLVLNSGLFMVSFLHATGGAIIFNGGTLISGGTAYSITTPFGVGDGTDPAVFQMSGSIHTFNGGLIISSNGLLVGSGTIVGNVSVNNGGTIAPGTNNIVTITANSGLTLNPGSTTAMKLNASSGACDTFTGMTNATYGGTLQVTNVSTVHFHNGNSFKLFIANNYSGAFSAVVPATPGSGLRWDTSELNVNGTLRVVSTPTQPPSFSSVTSANGNLLLTATGGIPYDPCYLLTSTNLAAPLADWSYVATNYFDITGSTSFTNSISQDQPQQFFQLQVN